MSESASWEEIKRLAADFRRIQLVESTYKLSERNCVEIVNIIGQLGLMNLTYTLDGKEYVTDQQITKEIYDELYVHGGRINIVQLQTLLNIDTKHIERRISDLIKNDQELVFTLGQIISKDYLNNVAEEINDLLQEKGSVSIADLTTFYELPSEFIEQLLRQRLGTLINGHLDNKILYTENYIKRQQSVILGVLEATIKPIRLSQLVREYGIDFNILADATNQLISKGELNGAIYGGKQETSVYVPFIYENAQKTYTDSFYKQNGYIDYSTLRKIGITEPDEYVRKLFGTQNVKYYSTCCVGDYLLDQLEMNCEDSLNSHGYCELSTLLPSVISEKDTAAIATKLCAKMKSSSNAAKYEPIIMCDTFLVNSHYLNQLKSEFQKQMDAAANGDLRKPKVVIGLKTNSITIGNISGTSTLQDTGAGKATKGKGGKKGAGDSKQAAAAASARDVSDDVLVEVVFIDEARLRKELQAKVKDAPDCLVDSITEHLLRPLNQLYLEVLHEKLKSGLVLDTPEGQANQGGAAAAVVAGAVGGKEKFSTKNVQEKMKNFIINSKLFDKAAKSFTNTKCQDQLQKHLIKSTLNDMCNELFKYVAHEQAVQYNESNLNQDTRNKMLQSFKEPQKGLLTKLQESINKQSPAEIIELIENVSADILELRLKKTDQKKEKEVLLELKLATENSLINENDAAVVMQLACIILYYTSKNLIINLPGRCVPFVIESLKQNLKEETYNKLHELQNIVIESISKPTQNQDDKIKIEQLVETVKSICLNPNDHFKTT